MALTNKKIQKRYKDGASYFERYVDSLKDAIEDVSRTTNLNLTQLKKDLFYNAYNYTNDGVAQLGQSLQDQINSLAAGGIPLTGTTSNTFVIRSASNSLTLSAASLTTPITVTFPDESGEAVIDAAEQTLTNKTITNPFIETLQEGVYGLGFKYSAGTFTICKSDGTDLSSTNYGFVTIYSSVSVGQLVTLKVESNISFNDDAHASSDIVGEEFGTTSGVAWGESRPFFIYAVNTDDTGSGLVFSISPLPSFRASPSSSSRIGYKGNPASSASDRTMFFLLSSSPAAYVDKPCVLVGSFRMEKSTLDDWTVQTLNFDDWGDGVGYGFESARWIMPQGQMGASSNTFFLPNGGTAPIFSSRIYRYSMTRTTFSAQIFLSGDGGTDGAGAVEARLVTPYILPTSIAWANIVSTGYVLSAGGTDGVCLFHADSASSPYMKIYTTATTEIQLSSFSAGNRVVSVFLNCHLART